MRACARNCTPRSVFVYVRACVRDVAARTCVRSEGGRRREPCEQANERASERLEPQIPFVRASSATAHDSTSSLPLILLLLLLLRSSTHRSPHALRHPPSLPPFWTHDAIASRSFARCFSLGPSSCSPLCRIRTPSRLHHSLPPSLCHSIAAESSQPDAGTARGRNDPRARQGRAEGVIRSSPYVHRAAPGIRIIKLRDSLPHPSDHPACLVIPRFSVG